MGNRKMRFRGSGKPNLNTSQLHKGLPLSVIQPLQVTYNIQLNQTLPTKQAPNRNYF